MLRHCLAINLYRFDTDTLKQHKKMKSSSILKYFQTFPDLCIWKATTAPISTAILSLLWKGYLLTFCRTASNHLRKLWIEISIHSRKDSTDILCVSNAVGVRPSSGTSGMYPFSKVWVKKHHWSGRGFGWNWNKREAHIYVFHVYENGCLLIKKNTGSQYFNYSLHLFASDGINNLSS